MNYFSLVTNQFNKNHHISFFLYSKIMRLLTLNTELSVRVNGTMFVFGHTLIHPRILQGEVSDPQSSIIHFDSVLREIQILLQSTTGNVLADILYMHH